MTQVKESKLEDLGLVWVDCPHHQEEEVLSIEKALVEAKVHVYSGRKLPVGEAADFVVLCPNGEDVVSEVRHLRALASDTPVLVFCSSLDPQLAKESLRAGASGFLYSGMQPELIAYALAAASRDEILISRELLEAFLEERASREEDLVVLSPRQVEFLELVVAHVTFGEEIVVPKELLEAFLVRGESFDLRHGRPSTRTEPLYTERRKKRGLAPSVEGHTPS